jgi:hypothetical protein
LPIHATIVALRRHPEDYGLPEALSHQRWYSEQDSVLWSVGNEYYGNIKVAVRGLCTLLAPPGAMFLHGCTMNVDDLGLALLGTSGAGKTTVTSALRAASRRRFEVVNDDWGPILLSDRTTHCTMEPRWHMKYPSVRALCPELELSPAAFPSENFSGDDLDPRARLLIPPNRVFGADSLAPYARLDAVLVLVRHRPVERTVRRVTLADLPMFEAAEHSAFYDRDERFFDGSLLLYNESLLDRQRHRVRELIETLPVFLVSNDGSPASVAWTIIDAARQG